MNAGLAFADIPNNARQPFARFFPRRMGVLTALIFAGGALAWGVWRETPVGRVRGRVVLGENNQPLARVKVTLTQGGDDDDETADIENADDAGGVQRIRAVTNERGEFEIPRVAVGFYHLSAASRAHSTKETKVFVDEDETSDVPLELRRSQPDLQLTQQQKEWLPQEKITLPLHGYVDGKAGKRDVLRVRIFRTSLRNILRDSGAADALSKVGDRYSGVARLPRALLHPVKVVAPQLVATRTESLNGADIEGFFHKRLDLGTLGAGLYLVDVAHGNDSVCARVAVSGTALIVKKARDQLLAFAVDTKTGAPRAKAAIQVLQDGRVRARAQTDAQGLARIDLSRNADESSGRLMTLASFHSDEATVGQYDSESGENEDRGLWTVHAYTDRPLYRPGGQVFYKGILRRTLDKGIRYGVPKGEPVDVEVRDPSGQRVSKARLTTNRFGSFHGSLELSPEAPTGSYSVVMTARGEEHTSDFRVASYRKPEFSASVTPNEKHYAYGDTVEMFVAATYYFGAPVAGARVKYSITRAPDWASMYGDADDEDEDAPHEYSSDGEGDYDGSGEVVQDGEATLDQNGHAVIRFEAQRNTKSSGEDVSEMPQDQNYSVQATVIDNAKREVEAEGQVPVTAGDFRLSTQTQGYFASPGKATTLSITARDFAGKPVAGAPLEIASSYHQWNMETMKTRIVPARTYRATTGKDGVARIEITPSQEGELFLQAQAQDGENRAITATRVLWIAGDEGGDYQAQYSELSLLTDKKRYQTGETARVLINSERRGGNALVTIEGSKLFRSWLVPLAHRSTTLRVLMRDDYGPNVTLAACLVRDKKFAQSQAPLRVDVPKRDVRIAIAADRHKYAPGEKITYQVQTTDAQGKPVPCEVSFGVVDEAIYALQEDDPRALRTAFYPRNPNSVETGYSFEPLYLGDVNKATPVIEARRKFLDTAFWQPDLQTDESGHASVSFALPDNLTTWRATATAQTLDTAFGTKTQQVMVAKDFFVRLETPRFFTSGDSTQVTALVHNDTAKEQDATIQLEADGLTLGGETTQNIRIASGGVGQIAWPITTDNAGLNMANQAHFKLSAWTPKDGNSQFTDAIENTIPVRPHGRARLESFAGQLAGGANVTHQLLIDKSAIPSASQVTIRITPSVSDALVGALKYLVGFPYGCTEQTMSRFLPDILVQRTLKLKGARDPEAQKLASQLPRMVRDGLTRLSRFQHGSGGWGWWEADDDDPWMTAYVLYGLAQARGEGYDVNAEMMTNGRNAAMALLKREDKKMPAWQRPNWENTRAFLLYAVALASPSAKELTQIRNARAGLEATTLDSQALGYLSLLDRKLNPNDRAYASGDAWLELEKQLVGGDENLLHWKGSGHEGWSDWNDVTATALGLRAMIAHNPNDERIASVLLWLMTRRNGDNWNSTRDTAWVLGALCDYLDTQKSDARTTPRALQVLMSGKKIGNYAFSPARPNGEITLRVPWQKLRASSNELTLRSSGGAPIFYSVQVRQTIASDAPLQALQTTIPIQIAREYRRLIPRAAGGDKWSLQSEPTDNQLRQGDRIRVRLSFNVPRDLSYVLIEDAFPSGCEATERGSVDAGAGEGNEEWDNWWSNSDVRDDRIAFFARHLNKGKHVIEYNLRAQTPGTYGVLPTTLQAMYAPEVHAETSEARITIR